MYKEAHQIVYKIKPIVFETMEKSPTQIDKNVMLYFEWLLAAKKIYYKQYF
jgi:hypothetical protein